MDSECRDRIVAIALGFLGRPYGSEFACLDFVRAVYHSVGLTLPPLSLNLTQEDIENPPVGYVVYLRHKGSRKIRGFTHVAIILQNRMVIHASYYFGEAVVITDLEEMMRLYNLA